MCDENINERSNDETDMPWVKNHDDDVSGDDGFFISLKIDFFLMIFHIFCDKIHANWADKIPRYTVRLIVTN